MSEQEWLNAYCRYCRLFAYGKIAQWTISSAKYSSANQITWVTVLNKFLVISLTDSYRICLVYFIEQETPKEKESEFSHEKNDLEPIFEEVEPPYIEIYNGSETVDNEIPSSVLSKNVSEREFLSPEFEEKNSLSDELEGGERNINSTKNICNYKFLIF